MNITDLKDYKQDEQTGKFFYKGFECIATKTCPEHGTYPCVYMNEYGQSTVINDKECPLCNRTAIIEREIGRAMIPKRFYKKTFDNFLTATESQSSAKAIIADYAKNFDDNLENGRCMIFIGKVGTGKTHLAAALLREIISQGHTGLFISAGDLISDIRDTWREDSGVSTKELTKRFIDIDLLVIDEIGVQRSTDNEREILFSILNQRYNDVKPTILLTNCTIKEVQSYIGMRIYDRLKEDGGRIVTFTGESYRK